jgi:serine protease Do
MVSLIFRHLTGARATQVDVIPIGAHRELILGRASTAAVRFDARADRVVGRYHARVTLLDGTANCFTVSDLHSSNGTFVNGVRLSDAVPITSGDVVQLGRDGPCVAVYIASEPSIAAPPD